jgi:acyl-CoA reductase-like NAD-dependent aldehyde dehydrogenase
LVVGGGDPIDGDGAFYPPTVVAKVENRMVVAQEEIFGPVATITPFGDEREAAAIANDSKYGLVATVWTRDPARGHRLARLLKAGTVGVNTPNTAFPGIPFGGYKQSGFGREQALETLDMYLEAKSVLVGTGTKPFTPRVR